MNKGGRLKARAFKRPLFIYKMLYMFTLCTKRTEQLIYEFIYVKIDLTRVKSIQLNSPDGELN